MAGTILILAVAAPVLVGTVFAQNITLTNPLGTNCSSLTCPATKIIDFLFTLAIPLCGIMVIWGGFQIMTAAGKPEKVSSGKKTILYSVIGFVVILLAGSVAALIQGVFG